MNLTTVHRPEWAIDRRLQALMGESIRVAAESFSPHRWDGERLPDLIRCRDIVLPDNTRPDGLPVYFEGRLEHFERRVGIVHVQLGSAILAHRTAQGLVHFRGKSAVILGGPATVKLATPLAIERLPGSSHNYWNDLRWPRAQLELPWSEED